MTREESIKRIREACTAANPAIAELGFGCKVRAKARSFGESITFTITRATQYGNEVSEVRIQSPLISKTIKVEQIEEIIGRPIRLADVLLAIPKHKNNAIYYGNGKCYFEFGPEWNLLKDDLEEQSDETISWLAHLL